MSCDSTGGRRIIALDDIGENEYVTVSVGLRATVYLGKARKGVSIKSFQRKSEGEYVLWWILQRYAAVVNLRLGTFRNFCGPAIILAVRIRVPRQCDGFRERDGRCKSVSWIE